MLYCIALFFNELALTVAVCILFNLMSMARPLAATSGGKRHRRETRLLTLSVYNCIVIIYHYYYDSIIILFY